MNESNDEEFDTQFDRPEDSEQTVPCPSCGESVNIASNICGHCGAMVGGSVEVLARPKMGRRIVAVLVLAGMLGGAGFYAWDLASDSDDDLPAEGLLTPDLPAFETPDIDLDPGGKSDGYEVDIPKGEFASVDAFLSKLKRGGVPCEKTGGGSYDILDLATCRVDPTTYYTASVYFSDDAYDLAIDQWKGTDFFVVHDDNWMVLTLNESLANDVRDALGGRIES